MVPKSSLVQRHEKLWRKFFLLQLIFTFIQKQYSYVKLISHLVYWFRGSEQYRDDQRVRHKLFHFSRFAYTVIIVIEPGQKCQINSTYMDIRPNRRILSKLYPAKLSDADKITLERAFSRTVIRFNSQLQVQIRHWIWLLEPTGMIYGHSCSNTNICLELSRFDAHDRMR